MNTFFTLKHLLEELALERRRMIRKGLLKESGRSKFPVNRNSIVKLEKSGIIIRPMVTQVHLNREDRLYSKEEIEIIVKEVRKYVESKL